MTMSGKTVETDLTTGVLHNSEWVHRWDVGNTAFNQPRYAAVLDTFEEKIFEGKKKSVFVPLCGKSLDLLWMYEHGHTVCGVELAEQPIREFYEEHNISVDVQDIDGLGKLYKSQDGRLQVYIADLFDITVERCGQFDLIYDCRSLTAINVSDRKRYVDLMLSLMKPNGAYYLYAVEFDPSVWPGPPHPMGEQGVQELFVDRCNVEMIEKVDRTNQNVNTVTTSGDSAAPPKLSSAGAAIKNSSYLYNWWFSLTFK